MQGIERQGHLIQEINQQQSLSDIALTLNATLNLETLLKLTVTAVGSFFNADGALIFLPDETRRKLVLRAHYNQTSAKVELPTDVVVDAFSSVPGSVLQNREPFTLKDGIEQPLKNPVQSLLYVPMISRNNVVGVLGIYDLRKKEAFSGEMLKLIQQLASHAAVAIDNAHIYANSQARSFELALVTDAAEAVNSTLSLPRVLSLVGKNLLTALQINWVEVLICNAEQEEFIMLSSQRSASWEKDNPPVVVIKTPSFRKQLFNDNWIRITIDDMSLKEADLLDGAVEVVIFPLRDGDKLTGIIRLAFVEKDTCNPDEILQEVQRRGEKIAEAALSDNDNRALSYAYQISRVVETVGGCSFWVWEPEKERLKLRIDESSLVWNEPAYPLRDGSMFPTLLNIVNRQSIANYGTTSRNFPLDIERLAHEHRLQSMLLIPFVVRESEKGIVLIADTNRRHSFNSREVSLAQGLVLQAANAIKNAQLFQDLQHNIEKLKLTQAKLVQTARLSAIGELAAAVAHQINNPLTTILGDTALMLTDLAPDDINRESLLAVERAGKRAHEVVRRLLSMARQKSSEVPPELMDVNVTIYNTLALVEGTLFRARVHLELDLSRELPLAYGVSGELEDVWLNLLLNARDAVKQHKQPIVGIRSLYNTEEKTVNVQIWDNGPGLGDIDPEQLFDAFYTTKPPGEGTGLGLYICQSIIKRCGGKIETGVSPEGGALFTVFLPCDE